MEHNSIKFSTLTYNKLKKINIAQPVVLLEVFSVKSKSDLSTSFLEYDTSFKSSESLLGESFYKLPEGELLVLLFIDSDKQLFTTIRSRFGKSGDKKQYFMSKRNSHFWIEEISNGKD